MRNSFRLQCYKTISETFKKTRPHVVRSVKQIVQPGPGLTRSYYDRCSSYVSPGSRDIQCLQIWKFVAQMKNIDAKGLSAELSENICLAPNMFRMQIICISKILEEIGNKKPDRLKCRLGSRILRQKLHRGATLAG